MTSPRSRAAQVHLEVEGALARRFAGALSPRVKNEPERAAIGIDAVDALLGGGVPIGGMSELVGVESSGRTTIALSLLANITAQDTAAAWIDVSDAFDPESAALSGVDLRRLLWVRCAEPPAAAPAYEETRPAVKDESSSASQQRSSQPVPKGGGSPHPRFEAHGMSEAVASLLQAQPRSAAMWDRRARRMVGTPGAPNRTLAPFAAASPHREEQIPTDRMPARRSVAEAKAREATTRVAEGDKPVHPYCLPVPAQERRLDRSRGHSWAAIDRALRVSDLLLQAGGFSLLVLDFGSVPAEMAWRIPLSTWFRFRAACERTRTTLLLLTQHSCAKTSAEMVVHLRAGEIQAESGVMTGIGFALEVERERMRAAASNVVSIRKPPQAERDGRWQGQAAWAVRS